MFIVGLMIGVLLGVIGNALWKLQIEKMNYIPKLQFRRNKDGIECEFVCKAAQNGMMLIGLVVLKMRDFSKGNLDTWYEIWPIEKLDSDFTQIN